MAEWELAGRLAYGDYLQQRLQNIFRPEAIKLLTEAMRHYNSTVINPRIDAPPAVILHALSRAVQEAQDIKPPYPPQPVQHYASISHDKTTLEASLYYPRHDNVNKIEIDLCDVRAADGLQIVYDFERDGWVIKQAQFFEWATDDDYDRDGNGWIEVAFIQAWAQRKEHPSITAQNRQEVTP